MQDYIFSFDINLWRWNYTARYKLESWAYDLFGSVYLDLVECQTIQPNLFYKSHFFENLLFFSVIWFEL